MDKSVIFLEALKTLKEWSVLLIGIQLIMLVVMFVIATFGKREYVCNCRKYIFRSCLFSIISIVVGVNLVGTIPWSIQHISTFIDSYGDIYQFKNYLGIRLWTIAFTQHILAVISFVYIAIIVDAWTKYVKAADK
jgi:hypothetical protein